MSLVTFRRPTEDDAARMLRWRSAPRVTRFMNSDLEHDEAAQRAWIRACDARTDHAHWIIENGGRPIGCITLDRIDLGGGSAIWGFYIGEDAYLGLGGLIPPYVFNFAFDDRPGGLGLATLRADVLSGNDAASRLHALYGSRRTGCRPGALVKGDAVHDVLTYELRRDAWRSQTRFRRLTATLPVQPALAARLR